MYVFYCDDNIDGIYTGIYDAWSSKLGHANIKLQNNTNENYSLFDSYRYIKTDKEKSDKVASTLRKRLGHEAYATLYKAIMANDVRQINMSEKADYVYKTVVYALAMKNPSNVFSQLGVGYIMKTFALSRATSVEVNHLMGFVRFRELNNGIMFSKITPKQDCIYILAEHFADRFPGENLIIYDSNRHKAVMKPLGSEFVFYENIYLNQQGIDDITMEEDMCQKLWKRFYDSIAIEARVNAKLQMQNIPKRFWNDTVELKDKV